MSDNTVSTDSVNQPPVYLLPDAAACLAALNTVNSEPYTQEHIHTFVANKLAGRKLRSQGISLAVNLAIVDAVTQRELPSMTADILMMEIDEYVAALIAVALPSGIGGGLGYGPIFVDVYETPLADVITDAVVSLMILRNKGVIPFPIFYERERQFKEELARLDDDAKRLYAESCRATWDLTLKIWRNRD